jgi:hypothetical protein
MSAEACGVPKILMIYGRTDAEQVCVCVCVCVHVHVLVDMLYIDAWMQRRCPVYALMYVCMYVCMCVCTLFKGAQTQIRHVYIYIYIYIYI